MFGTSLEDINREQLKEQRKAAKQQEKQSTYLRNIMNSLSLEFS